MLAQLIVPVILVWAGYCIMLSGSMCMYYISKVACCSAFLLFFFAVVEFVKDCIKLGLLDHA